MKTELKYLLETRYSFMVRNEETASQIKNMYQQFSCEVDEGWYSHLNSLCEEISQVYNMHARLPSGYHRRSGKGKVRWPAFLLPLFGKPVQIHAFDAIDDFSFRLYPADNEIHEEIANIARKYENESLTICEKCGMRGVL